MSVLRQTARCGAIVFSLAIVVWQNMPQQSSSSAADSKTGGCATGSACFVATGVDCPDGAGACGQFYICTPAADGLGSCIPANFCSVFGCTLASGARCSGSTGGY